MKLSDIGAAYADLLIHLSRHNEALAVLERTRGRALLDLIARADVDLMALARQTASQKDLEAFEEAIRAESIARLALKEAEAKLARSNAGGAPSQRREALRLANQEFAESSAHLLAQVWSFFPDEQPAKIEDIAAALRERDRLLVFNWTADGVSALVLSGPSVSVHAWTLTSGRAETAELTQEVQQVALDFSQGPGSLAEIKVREDRRNALALRIFPPGLLATLESLRRVIVVPHGPLQDVPIEPFLASWGSFPLSISYSDSGSLYVSRLRRGAQQLDGRARSKSALLVADPTFQTAETAVHRVSATVAEHSVWSSDLDPMPESRVEIDVIGSSLRKAGADVVALTGPQAMRDRIYQDALDKRFLHLATHGFAGSHEQPYSAALALAPALEQNSDSAFLTLDDLIRNWRGRLDSCELVVLSACESSKGVRRGDSVMALPSGFMYAGAPSVVASLWRADDRAASLLMPRFYENMLGQYSQERMGFSAGTPMSKGLALTEAKSWLRGLGKQTTLQLAERGGMSTKAARSVAPSAEIDFSDPYYWAGFILVGSPD